MNRFATALVAVGLLAAPAHAQTTISQEKASSLSKPELYVPFAAALAGMAAWGLSHNPAASPAEVATAPTIGGTAGSSVSTTGTTGTTSTAGTTGTTGAADIDAPTQSVPEPASILLVATGLLGMALHRRRARRFDA